MNTKLSAATILLIISMAVEYIAIDTVKIYMALNYAVNDAVLFPIMLVPAVALIGPVFLGPIAGVVTDRISTRVYIVPLIAVCIWTPAVAVVAAMSNGFQLPALIILSLLAYLSANIRIASSKFLVPKDEYTPYHGAVVWILQIVPVFAPLLAGVLIASPLNSWVLYGGGIAILLIGSALFLLAQRSGSAEVSAKSAQGFKGMGVDMRAAATFIISDRPLSHSVVVAALVNVAVFTSGYAGVAALKSGTLTVFGTEIALHGAPLIALGLGALVGSTIAGRVKARYAPCQALEATMVASILLLLLQIAVMSHPLSLLATTGIGIAGSITSVLAWDVRLQRSRSDNIGTIAGLTGSAYKIPSLFFLPAIGWLAAIAGIQLASVAATASLALLYLVSRRSAVFRPQKGGGAL
ncbi:MFS transporter [Roseibium hamelinense]|uniref:MFS transporter n=1 Tax=Roseibium hamelinense TaxID=150831 RepID=A0A562SUP5_9HYPH|nr:MFS transporter [Roseibium hamelinense]TWI84744.1 MFS transporter [Roseibium hamelinense]